MAKRRLIFDIETDGLLDTLTKVHCLVIKDADTGDVWSCHNEVTSLGGTIEEGVFMLMEADLIIGHNIIKFDIPALRKVYPWFEVKVDQVFDTLVATRLIWTNLADLDYRRLNSSGTTYTLPRHMAGRHGLEAWGHRASLHKGDYAKIMKERGLDPWAEWSQEMQDYCEQDVEVTERLFQWIEREQYSTEALELEMEFAWIIQMQEEFGFPFDEASAWELHHQLTARRAELFQELQQAFPPWKVYTPFIPKRDNKKLGYVKGVLIHKEKEVSFNPSSRDHIAKCLKERYNWKPTEFTETGKPKVDETVLSRLSYPEAKLLAELFLIDKRLGALSEGKQAWLKLVKNGRIFGSVNTNGAVTGRCTHSHPNVAQVPSVKVHKEKGLLKGLSGGYGFESRSLFHAPEGWVLVGGDASGLELRCFAHFVAQWDRGEYVRILLEDDVHTANQTAVGLAERAMAKTFIYAFLYGAGDQKIGSIVAPNDSAKKQKEVGRRMKARFMDKLPAIGKLKKAVDKKAERGWLSGLDGRKLNVRSQHSALNTLLQSAGALIMKKATIFFYQELSTRGYIFGVDYALVAHVHDEMQVACRPEIADEVGLCIVNSIKKAGEYFKFKCPLDGEYKVGKTWAETH